MRCMEQVETELKFDIAPDAPLPALGALVQIGDAREHRMRAVYLDTADLVLARHRITLRRREGGADAGWHLKLPKGASRLEVHAPLGEGPGRMRVPDAHRAAASDALPEGLPDGVTGALLPAAVLSTVRVEVDLLDASGEKVAVLCDDSVTALPSRETWRELEIELAGGDEELLAGLAALLAEQGVEVASSPSKLARALGDRPARAESGTGVTRKDPAADVLLAYLVEQVAVIVGREDDVRADAPDAVHKTRVAVRRLRSALRTFRRLLDRDAVDAVRGELRWWGEVLGAARDAEVMRERIAEAVGELPAEMVQGPVAARVDTQLAARHTEAHAALVEAMSSERYLALTDSLLELLAEPPWRERARRRARAVLPELADRAVERAARERAAALDAEGEERLHLMHETRKRAKAARYAWEALAPAFGAEATARAMAWSRVTESLGGLQDSVVSVGWLRGLATSAEAAGEPTLTYGVLLGQELARHDTAVAEGEQALRAALD